MRTPRKKNEAPNGKRRLRHNKAETKTDRYKSSKEPWFWERTRQIPTDELLIGKPFTLVCHECSCRAYVAKNTKMAKLPFSIVCVRCNFATCYECVKQATDVKSTKRTPECVNKEDVHYLAIRGLPTIVHADVRR